MRGYLQIRSPWSQLGIFFGLLGAAFVVTSILMHLVLSSYGVNMIDIDYSDARTLRIMKVVQAVSSLTIFLLPALIFAKVTFSGSAWKFLGLRSPQKAVMLGIAVVVILVGFPFVFLLGEWNQQIPFPDWIKGMEEDAASAMEAFLKAENNFDILVNVFIIAFLPAICEEICFRGALQRVLIHIFRSPWAGIIAAAILFSALHLQFQGFFPRLFLGIVLGALYWYSGSLWPSILAHFVNNAVQVVAVSFAPQYISENPGLPVYTGITSGLLVFVLLWYYQRISASTYTKVYEDSEINRRDEFMA